MQKESKKENKIEKTEKKGKKPQFKKKSQGVKQAKLPEIKKEPKKKKLSAITSPLKEIDFQTIGLLVGLFRQSPRCRSI